MGVSKILLIKLFAAAFTSIFYEFLGLLMRLSEDVVSI